MRTRLIAVLALAASASCGVPTSDQAAVATAEDVPYGLLDPSRPTTTTTLPELARRPIRVWFVASDRIIPVPREVAVPVSIGRAVSALEAGPTDPEATIGLRSAVPAGAVVGAGLRAGVAAIDLDEAFASAAPREQLLALAQLVYTVTEVVGVQVVTFSLEGQPIDVPRGDGSISNGPVTRIDYSSIAAG